MEYERNETIDEDFEVPIRRWPDEPLKWVLDRWIQVLGIVFLLLGVGFLFQYSYEHGLLTPPMRVLCGAGIGATLAVAGWRIRDARKALAQVLLGGANATFYITLFAAAELYHLIPASVGFAGMMAVTMATFLASATERSPMLANVATIGGFLTPWLLDAPLPFYPGGEELGTLLYMCIILSGSTAMYLFHGWRSLLITAALAMWGYLTLAVLGADPPFEQTGVQAAIVFTWLATAVAPMVRLRFKPEQTPGYTTAHLLALVVPAVAMLLSRILWTLHDPWWGPITLVVAIAYAAASTYLRSTPGRGQTAMLHTVLAIGFGTLALTDVLSGPSLMTGLLIEAVALCWIGNTPERQDRLLSLIGHALLAVVCFDSVSLFVEPVATPFVGAQGLQLLSTALALALVGRVHEPEAIRPGFQWAAHVLFLGTVLHQTAPLAHGDLVATACWGVYSLALITRGLFTDRKNTQWMGLVALLLAAGKLLFVDMIGAETLWRVLLFLGFGAALLLLNYLAPQWTRTT